MSILISAHRLSKAFSARPLFTDLTFAIETHEKIGLIGPNGAGKSTLLKILASQITPDSGTLSFQRGIKVGFLQQVPIFAEDETILSAFTNALQPPADSSAEPLADWEIQTLAEEQISKLQLDQFSMDFQVQRLSGGWKKRVALGRELIKKPDLLLLDEPTNHLDFESILWLEEALAQVRFSTLTVTHDRLFLQRVSNRIWEIDARNAQGLLQVQGNYTDYLDIKESLIQAQEKREVRLKNTLRRETEWLRQGAKARTTKQEARIQRAGQLKEEVAELTVRNVNRTAQLNFGSTEKSPKKLLEVQKISKSFGKRNLFSDVSLTLRAGSRLGLLGPNGAGKSTLIRILLQMESPDDGLVLPSDLLEVAYFDQTREALDPELSLLKTLCPSGDFVDFRGGRMHIRSYLDRFLFTPGQMEMAVGKLSGGEQSRVLLAKLMLRSANLLILDEPTNDLDLPTLTVLEECLTDYPGAVILVTHDRFFLDQVANQLLAFPSHESKLQNEPTKLITFASYAQWEDWYNEQRAEQKKRPAQQKQNSTTQNQTPSQTSTPSAPTGTKRKLSFKEQNEFNTIEERIHVAEKQLEEFSTQMNLPGMMQDGKKLATLTQQMSDLQKSIDRLYERWSELENPVKK